MKSTVIASLAAAMAVLSGGLPASAGDIQGDAYPCEDLWVMRNEIFKKNGYCFKTEKAITYFGIGGCTIADEADLPLTKQEQSILHDIRQSEGRQGC